MGKQLSVSKMPKTRGIIGHGIGGTSNVVITKAVTVVTLVKAGKAKEVGGGSHGR